MSDYGYAFPVDRLLFLGKEPACIRPWYDYCGIGIEPVHVPELIRMATDPRLNNLYEDDQQVWAPIHAVRTLGQLGAVSAVEPLLEHLASYDPVRADDWIMEDAAVAIAMMGPSALPQLKAFLARKDLDQYIRHVAANALVKTAKLHAESRPDCIAALAERLEDFNNQEPEFNGFLVGDLIDLDAVETLPLIERAYESGLTDESICGDFEDVQIAMGVKSQREHPREDWDWSWGSPRLARIWPGE